MSDDVIQLIGYLFLLVILMLVLRYTCSKTPKRDNVVSIRKDGGDDAA